ACTASVLAAEIEANGPCIGAWIVCTGCSLTCLQRRGSFDERGSLVGGAGQTFAVEGEQDDDDAVDSEVGVSLDAIRVGALEVRAHADLDLGPRSVLGLEGAIKTFERLRHFVRL